MRFLVIFVFIISLSAAPLGFNQFGLNAFTCDDVTEISTTECLALVAFYNSTNGPGWKNNLNWLVTNTPHDWYGVTVSYGSVAELQLTYNQLSGPIPPELGLLVKLEYLNLSRNQLSGAIPPSLGNLSQLWALFLGNNQLTGPIPPELGSLTHLSSLDLSWNQLTGEIPGEMGSLQVWLFDLSANQLSGSIPPQLGLLPMVREFQLQGNELTGSIPPELGNLVALQRLDLSYNHLSGPIPPELGYLTNLWGLYLYNNELSGSIPPQIGNLSKLQYLALSSNQLTGPIPDELGNLSLLTDLELSWNPLNSTFPLAVTNLTALKGLYLASCKLYGPLPEQIGNLINLEAFSLQSNQLVGDLPPKMMQLVNLTFLSLGYNHFTVPAHPQELADFLAVKDPYWDRTQGFDQSVDQGTEATVTALDGSTVIHIYSASLETDVTFSFIPQLEPNEVTGDLTFLGNSFLLNAISELGDPVTVFAQPLTVEIYYDVSLIGNIPEKRLALYYWNLDDSKWYDVVTTCENGVYTRDLELNMFSVQLCHLSEFSLMAKGNSYLYLPAIIR